MLLNYSKEKRRENLEHEMRTYMQLSMGITEAISDALMRLSLF